MLTITGATNTPEYQAARELATRITKTWPDIATNSQHHMLLASNVKCYGQPICDIDLLILFHTSIPYQLASPPGDDTPPLHLISLAMVIEIKDHSPDRVRFVGTHVEVLYQNRWHNVSEQNFKQPFSVRDFLSVQGIKPPFVTNFIWLRHVPQAQLPKTIPNVLGKEVTWDHILERFRLQVRPYWNASTKKLQSSAGGDFPLAIQAFSQTYTLQPTQNEEEKVNRVIKAATAARTGQVPSYVTKLGSQLLLIQGRGGTGKTATLLNLAHMLYEHRNVRILILTYNKVLAADIRRLLALMGVHDGVARQSIAVQTSHAFFRQLMLGFGIISESTTDFIQRYDEYKMNLEILLSSNQDRVMDLIQENNTAFSWDFIFIDEAQDWPVDERNILYAIYPYQSFVIADGGDQLTRSTNRCNWIEQIPVHQRQIISLRKSLRLKAGVCRFANAFARQVGLEDWVVEPYGNDPGRVIVFQGKYAQENSFHQELAQELTAQGRSPIDMLFCVTPEMAKARDKKTGQPIIISVLEQWGVACWDATDQELKNQYPIDTNQVRVVQYDSCRGLEAWTVVHLGFDELYDYKCKRFEPTEEEKKDIFFHQEQAAHEYAIRWLMIPLTRGIHTLVLQISPAAREDHPVVAALQAIARDNPGFIEWRKATTNK